MYERKGISLPINMLVILAISIIVLLAAVAFFMGTFTGQSGQIGHQQKVSKCCQNYINAGECGSGESSIECTIGGEEITVQDPDNSCCMGAGSGSDSGSSDSDFDGSDGGGGVSMDDLVPS